MRDTRYLLDTWTPYDDMTFASPLRLVPPDPDPLEFPPRRWACSGCAGDRQDCHVERCGGFEIVPPPTLPPDGTPGAIPLRRAA